MEPKNELPTTINFICTKDEKMKLSEFFSSVKFEYAKIEKEFNSSNKIEIHVELEENCINYNEILSFRTKDNKIINADYPIYVHKNNNIYVDFSIVQNDNQIGEDTKLISLEVVFQTVENQLLPDTVIYDNKELSTFDTYENNLRKRIGLININPEKLNLFVEVKKQYPGLILDYSFENSYQLIVRIPKEGDIKYSMGLLDSNIYAPLRIKKAKYNYTFDKKGIHKSFCECKKDISDFMNEIEFPIKNIYNVKTKVESLYQKYQRLISMQMYYWENILNCQNFEEIDIEIFKEKYYLLELQEIKKASDSDQRDENLMNTLFYFKESHQNYEDSIRSIKKMDINIKDKLSLIKVYISTFMSSVSSKEDIRFIKTVVIEKEQRNNPYVRAVEFVKKIINNLTEESRLFEIFLYLDSDVIQNILIPQIARESNILNPYGKYKNIKYNKNPTEYGVNMANIKEIKKHLINLLPKYIIRINCDFKINASYDVSAKIMCLNEKHLLKHSSFLLNYIFEVDKYSEKFVLPIAIEILHELLGHAKKRITDNKAFSAEGYRDSKYNYEMCNITRIINDLEKIKYPESGYALENYISENRKVMHWLKTAHSNKKEIIKKIMDVKYWVDKDFNDLESIVNKEIGPEPIENSKEYFGLIGTEVVLESDDIVCLEDDIVH